MQNLCNLLGGGREAIKDYIGLQGGEGEDLEVQKKDFVIFSRR